jgi:ribosomal protein L16 Arg81 hydroxylase
MLMNDNWRQWIAENLALNARPDQLADILVEHGASRSEADHEVQLARSSPYVQGAVSAMARAQRRLSKREWVLDIYSTLDRQGASDGSVERRYRLTREEFYRQYYLRNKPVIITGMLDDWPALAKWNLDYLRDRAGGSEVEVQMGRSADSDYEINSIQLKRRMLFGDYLGLLATAGATNDFYMTANNSSHNRQALAPLWEDIGRLPEYLNPQAADDGFLWIGPEGTHTPLHHDLTNNFMAQLIGRKRIRLIAACELVRVYNHRHCFSQVDGFAIDYERFPMMREVRMQECTLAPGEILFLPVGAWHCVEGLDVSVTVSMINFLLENDFSKTYVSNGEL